jgi:hypothetical protein
MSFDYGSRSMWLKDLDGDMVSGAGYPFCGRHAARLSAPVGWTLTDHRSPMARLFAVPA